jgi:hypothetical protein
MDEYDICIIDMILNLDMMFDEKREEPCTVAAITEAVQKRLRRIGEDITEEEIAEYLRILENDGYLQKVSADN